MNTTDEKCGYYSFHRSPKELPSVLLIKTRRKDDPVGSYVPVADLNDVEMKRVWNDLEIGSCNIEENYVKDCLLFDYPLEKAEEGFDVKTPFLKNTLFIKYKKSEVVGDQLYGVFLIHMENNDIVITELFRMSVRKNAKRVLRVEDGVSVFESVSFVDCKLSRYNDGRLDYYAYSLRFQSPGTGKYHICNLITNIVIHQ